MGRQGGSVRGRMDVLGRWKNTCGLKLGMSGVMGRGWAEGYSL